jgi:histidine triad (HIT) family protein
VAATVGNQQGCAFCRIVADVEGAATAGEEPVTVPDAHVVFGDAVSIAFLDRRPVFPGHTLLVPRAHVASLAYLPADLAGPLFLNARLLSLAMERALGAEGAFVALNNRVSQSVPHLHIHVVPRRRKDGLRGFFWPRTTYPDEATAADVRDRLRAAVADLR